MTGNATQIPAAIDALVTKLTIAIGTTTNVVDGPPLSWGPLALPASEVSENRYLFIGARPDDDDSADGENEFNAAGAVSLDERFTIYCTAFVWSGALNLKANRDDCAGIVTTVRSKIAEDPTLAGAVLYARVAAITGLAQRQDEQGSDVTIVFPVACRAYLT
jgi:hypothetical protein